MPGALDLAERIRAPAADAGRCGWHPPCRARRRTGDRSPSENPGRDPRASGGCVRRARRSAAPPFHGGKARGHAGESAHEGGIHARARRRDPPPAGFRRRQCAASPNAFTAGLFMNEPFPSHRIQLNPSKTPTKMGLSAVTGKRPSFARPDFVHHKIRQASGQPSILKIPTSLPEIGPLRCQFPSAARDGGLPREHLAALEIIVPDHRELGDALRIAMRETPWSCVSRGCRWLPAGIGKPPPPGPGRRPPDPARAACNTGRAAGGAPPC